MDCESCEEHLSQVLLTGRPRKLLDAIRQGVLSRRYGGEASRDAATDVVPPRGLQVECHVCPTTGPAAGARAFLESPPPGVVLCANRLGSRQEVEEAVVHELVHAYDYMVAGVELRECRSLAYSEVRAAHAAECSEASRSFTCSFFKKHCVRSTAKRSTEGIFPREGAACVDAVFDAAYKDKGPHNALAGNERVPRDPPTLAGKERAPRDPSPTIDRARDE